MKKIKEITSAVLAAAAILSICASCSSNGAIGRVKHNGILKVGYSSYGSSFNAPFVMDGKGITAEPAHKVAETLDVKADFIHLNSDEAYERLLDGTADCLWNVAPPQKQLVSSVRTIDTGIYYRQVIMTSANSNITRLADVTGKKLAVVSGSDAQAELHQASVMESSLSEIKIYLSMEDILSALTSGEADCAAVDEPQALYHTIGSSNKFKFIDTPISEKSLVIATRAEDADLCSKIAEIYTRMSQNGEIKFLCNQYTAGEKIISSMQPTSSDIKQSISL